MLPDTWALACIGTKYSADISRTLGVPSSSEKGPLRIAWFISDIVSIYDGVDRVIEERLKSDPGRQFCRVSGTTWIRDCS